MCKLDTRTDIVQKVARSLLMDGPGASGTAYDLLGLLAKERDTLTSALAQAQALLRDAAPALLGIAGKDIERMRERLKAAGVET